MSVRYQEVHGKKYTGNSSVRNTTRNELREQQYSDEISFSFCFFWLPLCETMSSVADKRDRNGWAINGKTRREARPRLTAFKLCFSFERSKKEGREGERIKTKVRSQVCKVFRVGVAVKVQPRLGKNVTIWGHPEASSRARKLCMHNSGLLRTKP